MTSISAPPSPAAPTAADVKAAVRARYGQVARAGSDCGCSPAREDRRCGAGPADLPLSSESASATRASLTTTGCCAPAATPSRTVSAAPESAFAGSGSPATSLRELDLGCGNPLPFAGIRAGDTVLDLGSGSGAEVLRAARMVGAAGRAIGVDLTREMLELARRNAAAAGVANAEFLEGDVESLPLPDASVDVIVSNCVLNLTPDKAAAFGEAFRVLRPGGRFVVADVVLAGGAEPDPAWRADVNGWSACVRGAMSEEGYARGLEAAGFDEVRLERIAGYEACAGEAEEVEIVSDLIRARKPEVTFEPLGEGDLPEATALLDEAGLSAAGLDAAALAAGEARLFGLRGGADGGSDLVATGAWERGEGAVLLRSMAVRRDRRGRGLGRVLLERLIATARSAGAREAMLFTEGAEGFFAAHGWERVPREIVEERFPHSAQVRGACPATAVPMRRGLEEEVPQP